MKQLQNNYTTPEQSKRLLELGVPADSADCYICTVGNLYNVTVPQIRREGDASISPYTHLPIWSVGRLMEIYDMCVMNSTGSWADYTTRLNYVNYLVSCFEISDFDFSKLED